MDEYDKAERIIICGQNECSICGKEFKYRFPRWRFLDTPEGLYEVKFKTEHPACLSLLRKIERLKNEILDLEFDLFRKKN